MFLSYSRYLFLTLLGPALFIAASLTAIIWLTQALRFIDWMVNKGLDIGTFLYMTLLLLPSLVGIVLPIALFCGVLYSYHRLQGDSELVVMASAGLSRLAIAGPALCLGGIMAAFGYLVSLYLMPASYREFRELQYLIRNQYSAVLLQEDIFNSPVEGLTVFIRERDEAGVLHGILVHDSRDPANPVTMMAEEGQMVSKAGTPYLVLRNGSQQQLTDRFVEGKEPNLNQLHFEQYTLDISRYQKEPEVRYLKDKERFLGELLNPVDIQPRHRPKLIAEGHQRLTWPLYTIVLALVALAGILSGPYNRRGQARRMIAAAIGAIVTIAGALTLQNLAAKQPWLISGMYLWPLLTGGVALKLLVSSRPLPSMPSSLLFRLLPRSVKGL